MFKFKKDYDYEIEVLKNATDQLAQAYLYILELVGQLRDNDKKYIKIKPFISAVNFFNSIEIKEAVLKKDKYYEITDEYKNKKEEDELIDIYNFYNKKGE